MTANELRIGNYVWDNYSGNMEVSQIFADTNYIDLRKNNTKPSGRYSLDVIQPIPLTEEWLVKFGFKPLSKDWQKNRIIIHTRKRGFVLRKSVPDIKYVHQLQNLYFALTGEELTIK